jgi:hypothetical protein
MEQCAVTRFLTLKGINSQHIHSELMSVSGDAPALSPVQKWHLRFQQGKTELCDDPCSDEPLSHDFAGAIEPVLKEKPFISCNILCLRFRIRKEACLRTLHDRLRSKKCNLRWVVDSFDPNQQANRVIVSEELLAFSNVISQTISSTLPQGITPVLVFDPDKSIGAAPRDRIPESL